MSAQEVITLQFGNYSNFVGTHFWNLQNKNTCDGDNEFDRSKLFRESLNSNNQYVPRMISFDARNSLKALKLDGTFQISDERNILDDCVTYVQERVEKNDTCLHSHAEKSSIDEKIKSWSDFMTYPLNENSLQLLRNRFDEETSFTYHGLGLEEYQHVMNDVDDKLHYWAEECNNMEGFLIFTDMHNGFSGLTTKMLEELQEEYGRKSFLTFINWPVLENSSDITYYLNTAFSFQAFKENSNLFVLQSLQNDLFSRKPNPICISNAEYDPHLPYRATAILASAINSATAPWREMKKASMADISYHLSHGSQKLVGNSIGFPLLTDAEDIGLFDKMFSVNELYGPLVTSLFPLSNNPTINPISQSVVFQDCFNSIIPVFKPKLLHSLGLNNDIFYNNPDRITDFFIQRWYPPNATSSKVFYRKANKSFNSPLPHIVTPSWKTDPEVTSALFTSGRFHDLLKEVINCIKTIKLGKYDYLDQLGFNDDARKELLEDMQSLAEEYNFKEVMEIDE